MKISVIVLGGGGHARVIVDSLKLLGVPVLGFTSPQGESDPLIKSITYLGDDEAVFQYYPDNVRLVNGVGSVGRPTLRRHLYDVFTARGYSFLPVVHPSAVLASDTQLSDGAQCMAGAIIQTGSYIGRNSIVNTKASVDHDCLIGDHVHIAPGVTLSAGVKVGNGVHIGTGAVVIQYIEIGAGSVIGAGAVVTRDISPHIKVVGIPARPI